MTKPNRSSSTEQRAQLVVEFSVRELEASLGFYQALGFRLYRRTARFAALQWGEAFLYLIEEANRLLVGWAHRMGACQRPFAQQLRCHAMFVHQEPVALAVAAPLVRETCAGLKREETIERLFEANGWGGTWRNGVFDYLHYHVTVHEVLGVARGSARVRFGGDHGQDGRLGQGEPGGQGRRQGS